MRRGAVVAGVGADGPDGPGAAAAERAEDQDPEDPNHGSGQAERPSTTTVAMTSKEETAACISRLLRKKAILQLYRILGTGSLVSMDGKDALAMTAQGKQAAIFKT